MVLRVKPSPTRLPTNSLYTPMDNTPLHSLPSVCHPWDWQLLFCFLYVGIGTRKSNSGSTFIWREDGDALVSF